MTWPPSRRGTARPGGECGKPRSRSPPACRGAAGAPPAPRPAPAGEDAWLGRAWPWLRVLGGEGGHARPRGGAGWCCAPAAEPPAPGPLAGCPLQGLRHGPAGEGVISTGHQGSVYEVHLHDGCSEWLQCAMKVPHVGGICIADPCAGATCAAPGGAALDQAWICVPCHGRRGFFHLCNPGVGDLVLTVLARGAAGQGLALDVSEGRDEHGAAVIAYRAVAGGGPAGDNQRWRLQELAAPGRGGPLGVDAVRLVAILSAMPGSRALTVRSGCQARVQLADEVSHLARWSHEAGLVQLRQVVWGWGIPRGIIMERLGKQLGRGTAQPDADCLLRDLRERAGPRPLLEALSTAAGVARSLAPVASLLRRLHSDGYAHNDLHDGNILLQPQAGSFKVIDLGSTTPVDRWAAEVGAVPGSRWGAARDWRALSVAFLGLLSGGVQLSVWELVGTNGDATSEGKPCPWAPPASGGAGGCDGPDEAAVPPDAAALAGRGASGRTAAEAAALAALLRALFAPRVDGDEACEAFAALSRAR
ncbi:unnamed protein product [Prorocentrum cordatum]|uniref:Protein kinase domain-containing protein n=1 Tax=Prorocentrum cordatum TaxID=2364126 RepID=A0ABN9R114_9DINO|nr:unnamed protein product [Polarella glacialis]